MSQDGWADVGHGIKVLAAVFVAGCGGRAAGTGMMLGLRLVRRVLRFQSSAFAICTFVVGVRTGLHNDTVCLVRTCSLQNCLAPPMCKKQSKAQANGLKYETPYCVIYREPGFPFIMQR